MLIKRSTGGSNGNVALESESNVTKSTSNVANENGSFSLSTTSKNMTNTNHSQNTTPVQVDKKLASEMTSARALANANFNTSANLKGKYESSQLINHVNQGNTYASKEALKSKAFRSEKDKEMQKYLLSEMTITDRAGNVRKTTMFDEIAKYDGEAGLSQKDFEKLSKLDAQSGGEDNTREANELTTLSGHDFRIAEDKAKGRFKEVRYAKDHAIPGNTPGQVLSSSICSPDVDKKVQSELSSISKEWANPGENSPLTRTQIRIETGSKGPEGTSTVKKSPKELYDKFTADGGKIIFTDKDDLAQRFSGNGSLDNLQKANGFLDDNEDPPVMYINMDQHVVSKNHASINSTITHELTHHYQNKMHHGNLASGKEQNLKELQHREKEAKIAGAQVANAYGIKCDPHALYGDIQADFVNGKGVYNEPAHFKETPFGNEGTAVDLFASTDGTISKDQVKSFYEGRLNAAGRTAEENRTNLDNIQERVHGYKDLGHNILMSAHANRPKVEQTTSKYVAALQEGDAKKTTFTQKDFEKLAQQDSYGKTLQGGDVVFSPHVMTNPDDVEKYIAYREKKDDTPLTGSVTSSTPSEMFHEIAAYKIGMDYIQDPKNRMQKKGYSYDEVMSVARRATGTNSNEALEQYLIRNEDRVSVTEKDIGKYFMMYDASRNMEYHVKPKTFGQTSLVD